MSTLLIVDDDVRLAEMLRDYLGGQGYGVHIAHDGPAMWRALADGPVDLVILDWMLPGTDGLSLARRLREGSGPPILMLSAKGEDEERIEGLEGGVDDFLAKPFNPRELAARVRALLRRAGGGGDQGFGPFRVDLTGRRLLKGDEELPVGAAEFDLLAVLVSRPERILDRETLLRLLGGDTGERFDRSIDVRVTRLRRLIEDDPRHPRYIETVRGHGYRFRPTP